MSENQNASLNVQPQIIPGAQPTPTFNAAHILITASLGEMSVMFGHTRLLPTQQQGGQIAAQALIEWFATITMSPMVAKQLRDGLDLALKQYVGQYGQLPAGPSPSVLAPAS